ncbi:hypothetical protein [Chenggangzhangella methanolivorans]|uniref:Uncharacterized protein n=1 Tax=Chenggangzhangella methanolivorans TaxID=1437009 RepID=A0A9E6RF44_9HYPH|nr:hypothetical protein [Chenggangzhangella methanolivorans]QZN99796.1 hypothetical protein K6K41_24555 [Chenggangzhangella methanolivorans]
MLRLVESGSKAPARIGLDGGAWVEVRIADLADYHAAMAEAAEISRSIEDGGFALAALGLALPDEIGGPLSQAAIREWAFNLAIGARCVVAWGGIGDEDGMEIAEPSADMVKLLMADPIVATRIVAAALRRVHEVHDEGEGSAGSRTGARETASLTAALAEKRARPARSPADRPTGSDVPSESTRP